MSGKQDFKRVYDETASVIMNLYLKRKIDSEEMNFLLNLLELVMVKKDRPEFIALLKQWKERQPEEEIDLIILETLRKTDINQPASLEASQEIIHDLLSVSGNGY